MKKLQDYIKRRLPRHQWRLLREVPTWEGVLYYDPFDFQFDRPLTFFRRLYCRELKEDIIYPMKVFETDVQTSYRNRGSKRKPMFRRQIKFAFGGKKNYINCSTLTMLCYTGFAIADPRHYVVMHMDENCLNDRPSNLHMGTQKENMRMSTAHFRYLHSKEHMMVLKRGRETQARKRRVEKMKVKEGLTPDPSPVGEGGAAKPRALR